jgi:hypothetical protein
MLRNVRLKHALDAADRLIGEVEPMVELAKVELASRERGQGRGGGQRLPYFGNFAAAIVRE